VKGYANSVEKVLEEPKRKTTLRAEIRQVFWLRFGRITPINSKVILQEASTLI